MARAKNAPQQGMVLLWYDLPVETVVEYEYQSTGRGFAGLRGRR